MPGSWLGGGQMNLGGKPVVQRKPDPLAFDPLEAFFGGGEAGVQDNSDLIRMQYQNEFARLNEQAAIANRERQLQAQLALGGYDQDVLAGQGQVGLLEAGLPAAVGEIEAMNRYRQGAIQQDSILSRGKMRNELAGRGLGQSGIRLGADSRQTADLLRQIAGLGLESGSQVNAVRSQTAMKIAEIKAAIAKANAQRDALRRYGGL